MTVIGMKQEILNDIKALIKKHNLTVHGYENWGGPSSNEMYCGSDYYFAIDGVLVDTKTIVNIFKELSEE